MHLFYLHVQDAPFMEAFDFQMKIIWFFRTSTPLKVAMRMQKLIAERKERTKVMHGEIQELIQSRRVELEADPSGRNSKDLLTLMLTTKGFNHSSCKCDNLSVFIS